MKMEEIMATGDASQKSTDEVDKNTMRPWNTGIAQFISLI